MKFSLHSLIVVTLLGCWGLTANAKNEPSQDAVTLLNAPGHVLVLRHADAPGVGDPPGMVLSDCTTQRNLNDRGRTHARNLGERLRQAGVSKARVYTSQWCRCRETATLLAVGDIEDLPALNSTFGRSQDQPARTAALRTFIDDLPRDGGPVILVTHQITITALTGHFPASGEGLILKLLPQGGFEQAAELSIE